MKKTLLALSVIAFAGSANAAIEIHNSENLNVKASGAAEVQVQKDRFNYDAKSGKFYNEDVKARIDDCDLAFDIQSPISETLTAFGGIQFACKSGDVVNDGLFVGAKNANHALSFGRDVLTVDASGVGVGYENELGFIAEDGNTTDLFLVTAGDQTIKYKFTGETFWAGASYVQDKNGATKTDKNAFDLGAGATFGAFGVAAYVQDGEANTATEKYSQFTYQLESTYKFDSAKLGASYSNSEIKDNGEKLDLDLVKFAASYTIGKTTLAGGYDFGKITYGKDSIKLNNVYANVTYKATSNFKTYAELGYLSSDELEKAIKADGAKLGAGVVLGAELSF